MTNKFKQYCIVGASIVVIFVFVLSGWEYIKEWLNTFADDEGKRYLAVGIGAIIALGLTAWRNYVLQKQADIAEKRYASEQFSQSVALLAKDNKDKPAIEARIGGVYALAQLAEADPKGYGARVMKTLVAYIRNNSQRTALSSEKDRNESISIPEKFSAPYPEERLDAAHLGEDVKTAFAELKRLHSSSDVRKDSGVNDDDLSFSHVDFHTLRLDEIEWIEKPDLSHANLSGANLISANLECAKLHEANLQGAYLEWANLQGANLQEANLQGANLELAGLQNAAVWGTKLQGADLRFAKLQGADLRWANFQGADFRNADLRGADFTNATAIYTAFEDVEFDKSTKFDDSVKEWRVWHDDNPLLLERGVQSLEPDVEWNLDLIFSETTDTSDVVFILEGILHNFAEKGNNKPDLRAIECRKAVKQWVEKHDLLEKLSDDWRDWLKSLDSNGYAPDDQHSPKETISSEV